MNDPGARSATPAGSFDGLHLDLDVFDGPFDLLVTLILRDEVDLWEIHVSRIVAEYILRLAETEEFDLEATSHFILLIAALLEMKSRRLLDAGSPFVDELADLDEQAAGEELLDTLLRFARFKGAAGRLGCLFAEHAGRLYRTGLSRTFQQARVFPQLSVEENLVVAAGYGWGRLFTRSITTSAKTAVVPAEWARTARRSKPWQSICEPEASVPLTCHPEITRLSRKSAPSAMRRRTTSPI